MLFFRRLFSTKREYSATEQLESLSNLFTVVNTTASTLEKQALLAKFPASHSTLKRIYDPHLRHYVTSKSVLAYLNKHPTTEEPVHDNLNDLLDSLSSRTLTGHTASAAVASFYTRYCQTEAQREIFWRVIDRNLKMGVSTQMVRQNLTSEPTNTKPHMSVALATSFGHTKKIRFEPEEGWYVSQKLDGIRCVAMVRSINDQYHVDFFSRTGRPFSSLEKLKVDIENRLKETNATTEFVLDGEVCAYSDDNTENEDFLKAVSQVRRMNQAMENPIYQVFDYIHLQTFLQGKGNELFTERQHHLTEFIGNSPLPHMKLVKQTKLKSMDHLNQLKEKAIQKGWEGLILRKDVPYEGKRS